jgi:hypothetical protein
MLGFLERTAVAAGVSNIFALSTHTMQWFMERGFAQVDLEQLPPRRVAVYDRGRGSKIYVRKRARRLRVRARARGQGVWRLAVERIPHGLECAGRAAALRMILRALGEHPRVLRSPCR